MARTGLDMTFKMKKFFFDRPAVTNRVDKMKRRKLSRAGALTRAIGRNSIKKKKRTRKEGRGKNRREVPQKPSPPGSPPFSYEEGTPNLRTILFAYEPNSESVIVGPVKLNSNRSVPPVPELHEKGGTARRTVKTRRGGVKIVRARYRKRPFMVPAMEKASDKYPELFTDAL